MSRLSLLLALLLTLCWTACCATLRPSYTIVIENSTDMKFQDTHVYWERFESVGGAMIPGATAAHHYVQAPLPPRVMVRWRTPDGVTHREEVTIPEGVPRRFQGTLRFEIQEDGQVEVRVEP